MTALAHLTDTPSWMADATCMDADPDAFHVPIGGDPRPAKRICDACPVSDECLQYALETGQRHGIWGGTTHRERLRIEYRDRPLDRSTCGTEAGYRAHYRRGVSPCGPCRKAARDAVARRAS